MPKVLITEPTQVNYGDDRGGVHQDAGEIIDAPKETARTLVVSGRALYVSKTDDPSKGGIFTASSEMLKAAKALADEKAKAADKAAA